MRTRIALVLCIITSVLMSVTAQAQIIFAANGSNGIGEYNALTGATINANFINNGANYMGMAFDSSTNILYAITNNGIGEYNATSGAAINTSFISFVSGANPFSLALSGGDLYVSNQGTGEVDAYNATTGMPLGGFSLTGVNTPRGIVAIGNTLYVVARGTGTVGTYNATTGAVINSSFITGLTGPSGMTVSGSNLWIANTDAGNGWVAKYDLSTSTLIPNFITGVATDFDVAYYNGDLYVGERNGASPGHVGLFDAATGAAVQNPFFAVNAGGPFNLLAVPETSTWVMSALAAGLLASQVIRAAMFSRRQTRQAAPAREAGCA